MKRKLEWMQQTEMAVVVSQEQNEIQTFRKWGLDILPHREKMENVSLTKNSKVPTIRCGLFCLCYVADRI